MSFVDRRSMLLYAVSSDLHLPGELPLAEQVRRAIAGGITFFQLREKSMPRPEIIREAVELQSICKAARIPFVIDDDAEAALAAGADGVHVGQSDVALAEARRILGPEKIIGVSAHTVEEALLAERGGADYLGVGAMFATQTKADAELVPMETLRAICQSVHIPVVAIGGIHAGNVAELASSGVDGIAVVSAIFSRPDIVQAARRLRVLCEKTFSWC